MVLNLMQSKIEIVLLNSSLELNQLLKVGT